MKTIIFSIALFFVLAAAAGSEASDLSEEKLYGFIKGMIIFLSSKISCNWFNFLEEVMKANARKVNADQESQRSFTSNEINIPKCCVTSEKLRDSIDKMVYQAVQDYVVKLLQQLADYKP